MRRWHSRLLVALVSAVALTAGGLPLLAAQADSGPAIATDQADYAPGSVVSLTGSGWPGGDTVHVTVDDSDGQTWSYAADPVADGSGAFGIQFTLPNWFVANYKAVATDASGATATTTFTDGNVSGKVFAGTTQVSETLQVTKYFGTAACTGRFKTQPITTSANASTNLAGVGGSSTNPQSIGVVPPAQIVVGTELFSFDHWTVTPKDGTATDQTANPCLSSTTSVVAHYADAGATTKKQQTISFPVIPDTTYGAADFQINPTSDSGLTVSVSATGSCTLSSTTSPATVHITGAGSCAIVASQAGDSTYLAATPVEQDFLIAASSTGVVVTVTCPSTGQTYTGSALTPCTASAVVDGGAPTDVTSSIVYANNTDVGTATATASYSDANHTATTGSSTFTIVPQPVDVTVSGTQVYGGSPTFLESNGTLPTGVSLSGTPTCADLSDGTAIASTLDAGSYTLLASSCSGITQTNPDYVVHYVGGAFSVSPESVVVTVTGGNTYGQTPAFQYSQAPTGVALTGAVTCTGTTGGSTISDSLAAGPYTIDPSTCGGLGAPSSDYAISYLGGSYVVTTADLTVTVTGDQTYGDAAPVLHGTATPSAPSGVAVDDSHLTCSRVGTGPTTAITSALAAGSYVIDRTSCSGATLTGSNAGNYDIVYAGSAFTVNAKAIDVVVTGTQTYGGNPVSYAPDYSTTAFANGENSSVVSGALSGCSNTATPTGVVGGSYTASCAGGLTADNYTITLVSGPFTVTAKPINVAVTGSQTYGGTSVSYAADYSHTDFVTGEGPSVVSGSLSGCSTSAGANDPVGSYTASCTGALSAANYTITLVSGTFTVTPKPITVTVNGTQVYGGSPSFTPDYTGVGWVGSDGPTSLTGPSGCTTNAISTSPVGSSYTVSGCALTSANYTVTVNTGTFTVTPKPITVTVNGTQVYGGSPSFTVDYTGVVWVGSDGPSVVTGPTGCLTNATATSPVGGSYTVSGCALTAANYTVTAGAGTLTVTPAPLTVTADNKSIVYGDAMPAYTYQVSGYVNGEGASALSTAPGCTSTATLSSPAGDYPITCSGGVAANYSFTYVAGTLHIAKKGATLGYTGGLFFSTGSATATTASVTLQATLTPGSGGSPSLSNGAPVTFRLYKSTNLAMTQPDATCVATTMTSAGVATCTISALNVDNWTVIASIGNNPYFTANDSDPVVLTVYQPATDKFATGGGWVNDAGSANRHGNFGFTVRYSKTGSPTGQAVFVYRGLDGYDYVVKSNSWNGGGLSFGTTTVSFSGKANVTVIDPTTGLAVSGLGGGNYTFRVDATDNGSGSSSPADTYAISVYTPTGTLYHQAGTSSATGQLPLGGGNITVHTSTK